MCRHVWGLLYVFKYQHGTNCPAMERTIYGMNHLWYEIRNTVQIVQGTDSPRTQYRHFERVTVSS